MIRRERRLRTRLMLAFASFTLLVAALFGLYAVIFVYVVEDAFFSAMLEREADAQLRYHAANGRWSPSHDDAMRVYPNLASLPAEVRDTLAAEPRRTEVAAGDGRHYHLRRLQPSASASPAYLLAEVSAQLVVRPMRAELFGLLAWTALAVIVLALAVGGWLAHRIAAPLARLATQVQGLQPERAPLAFAAHYRDHEVGVLARGLETLAARVHALVAREREFTRDASHELRTPLAVIRSACERLLHEPALSPQARRQVDFLRQSSQQLEHTVATLLSLAREDEVTATVASVAVLPVLEGVVVEQAVWLEGKPVAVAVDVPRQARMRVPESVLRILLANLVGNAFAHAGQGVVRIDVAAGRLRIANAGSLPDGVRDALYQPFTKGEASAGHGLGLAIVRRLCDRYGIDLRIDSVAGGTTASVAIELEAAPGAPV